MIDRLAPGSTALSTARVGGTALSLLAAQCAADARELRACRARWRASSVTRLFAPHLTISADPADLTTLFLLVGIQSIAVQFFLVSIVSGY